MAKTNDHSHGHDDHGAAHGHEAGDIIPENSFQDKLLILTAALVLAALVVTGYQWAVAPLAAAG